MVGSLGKRVVPRETGWFPGFSNIMLRRRVGSPVNMKRNYAMLELKHKCTSYTTSPRIPEILPGETPGFGVDASIHIH